MATSTNNEHIDQFRVLKASVPYREILRTLVSVDRLKPEGRKCPNIETYILTI